MTGGGTRTHFTKELAHLYQYGCEQVAKARGWKQLAGHPVALAIKAMSRVVAGGIHNVERQVTSGRQDPAAEDYQRADEKRDAVEAMAAKSSPVSALSFWASARSLSPSR